MDRGRIRRQIGRLMHNGFNFVDQNPELEEFVIDRLGPIVKNSAKIAGAAAAIPKSTVARFRKDITGNYESSNPRKQRKDKGKLRGPQKRTIEKENMAKEDININKIIKKNLQSNIVSSNPEDPEDPNNNTMARSKEFEKNNDELDVKPVPKSLSTIMFDYHTIRLPIRAIDTLTHIASWDSTRITLNDLNSTFQATPTLDFLGLSQWKGLFQYYRILEGELTVDLVNIGGVTNATDLLNEHITRYSFEFTDAGTARLQTARQMAEGKHNITGIIYPINAGYNGPTNKRITVKYNPKQFIEENGHVAETGDEDTWNAIAGAPTHPHYCHIVTTNNFGTVTADQSMMRLDIKYEIVVQFRETTDSILTTSQIS